MNTSFLKRMVILLTVSITSYSHSQITINNGYTATQLGNNLAGSNVQIFNAGISGDPDQYGLFQYTGNDLGLNSGVILSTGNIFDAVGPNSSSSTSSSMGGPGDPDLSALAGFNTNDAVVFEFDFEVQGDEIEFNFVFLSEEYNEFVNSGFNDVFAFYISGPGIVGQENLAVVPGTTTPVTINTINNGSFWQFYTDNTTGSVNIEFDGFTTLMTAAKSGLQECGIYTLSLRIADGSDSALDSGVLLQENSLVQSNISASSSTFSANNTALEGCIDASFTFQLDSVMPYPVNIPIGIGGTATSGVDYNLIDTLITIPAGQLSATIIIDAIADGLTEGQEVIELYFTPSPCQPEDTVFLYIDDYIPLEYNVSPTDVSCNGASDGQVDLSVTGGITPFTLTLTDSLSGDISSYTSFPVTGLDPGTYYVEVIDGYGCTAEDIVAGNLFDAGQTFIPDGQGGSYSSVINLAGFGAGATIQTADQIQSVCATMEHSRIGELEITLTSPGGQVVVLKEQPGGAVCNMGEPCAIGPADAGNNDTLPGIGYNYCWQTISTFGTMVSEANNYTYNYTNPCDLSIQSDKYLPSGSYQPYESFNNFIGESLNGGWTITVTDAIPNNNGYIFNWSISLQADPPDSVFTINEPAAPTISSATVAPDCGFSNGSIDLSITGGVAPFTYLWNTGATTQDLTNIPAGTYSVDITDDSLCVHTYQVNLSNNGSLVVNGAVSPELCADANDGAIDLTVSGGIAPISYSWSNGEITEDVLNLSPGTYTVTVSDGTGCIGNASFSIVAAPNININGLITNENCGDAEGIIDITVYGATAPVSYLWSNGAITEDADELSQGNYVIQITDANNCIATDTFTVINLVGNCIPSCDLAITNNNVINETCGNGNGSINLTVFTTNGPSLFNWSNGATTEDIYLLSAGSYSVTITDNEGCQETQTFNVTNQTGGLTITSINSVNENCGNGQGGADASVSGGAQPYSYSWSNGATTQDLTGVSAGTYALTVTDANGCSVTQNVTINNISGTLTQTYGNAVDEVCGNSSGSIDIQISGGQPPYSYSWSNGASTQDQTGLSAGTYSCTITDANACSINTPVYTVNNQSGSLAFTNIDVDNEVCSNASGEIEILFSGGTAPFTFSWTNGANTQDIFNLTAGSYTGTVTDANGCSINTGSLVVLNESGTLSLDGVSTFDELCGNSTGSINITVSGGTSPVSYLWTNGSTSQDISNLSAGTYNCTITDMDGCQVYAGGVISNDPGILNVDNIIVTNETCGAGDGALNLIISGEAAPVIYSWNNGATVEDPVGLSAGNYGVTVTDNNGCSTNGSAQILNITNGLNLNNSQITNELCGASNGSIDLTISGGSLPLSYNWNSSQTTEDLSGLSAGSYSCVITDNSGCAITAGPYQINNSSGSLNVVLVSALNESCGNSAGSIDVSVSGGIAPYSFSWSNGASTEDLNGLSAGMYTLNVSDQNSCIDNLSVEILNDAGTLTISNILVNDEICSGLNGAIDIEVSGGTPGYTYSWSNGAITQDISLLAAGTYNVTVNDVTGCSLNSGLISVNNNSGNFTVNGINVTNENCGDGMGYADLIVGGNTGSVTYLWSDGTTTQDLVNVSAGSYSGTATDVSGCTVTFSATVYDDPGNLIVSETISDATCGMTNGAIDLSISGASTPNSYVWSNGSNTEDISGLPAGAYTCNVTDAAGCSINYTGIVNDLGSPTISNITLSDETCSNSDGSILLSVTGGVQPYTYSWSGPPVSPCCTYTLDMQDQGNSWNGASIDVFIDGFFQGNYTVFGGGANVETFPVCDGETIELSWNPGGFDNEVSFDLLDGSGAIVFSQGANPGTGIIYTGTASCSAAPMDSEFINNLSAGTYTVVVSDQNGCQDSASVVLINSSGNLQILSALTNDETCSDSNGAIDLTLSGTAPFSFDWNNGATTEDLSGVQSGTYTVTVSDQNGCIVNAAYVLSNITNGLTISTSALLDETCGNSNGSIDIVTSGGAGPLSFLWSNGYTAQNISGLSAGVYTVTIGDGSICDYEESFTIINNTSGFSATASISDESCSSANGAIDLTVSGGNPPYSYLWDNGAITEDLSGLTEGVYTCTITDNNGCSFSNSFIVAGGNNGLTVTAVTTDEDCGDGDGAINASVSGGTGPYTYNWSNGPTTQDQINLNSGAYTLTVTDASGCTVTATFNVASSGNFNLTNVAIVDETCASANGSINLTFGGFGQPTNYEWSNGATTQDISNLSSGWYVVEYSSPFGPGGGCAVIDSFYVGQNQGSLLIDSLLLVNEGCSLNDGSIDTYFSGGTAPFNFQWDNGATSEDLTGLTGGSYTLTITDTDGCTAIASETISNYTFGFGVSGAILSDENCGDGSGAIDLIVSGGTSPYTFIWSNGATTEDISSLSAGVYTVTLSDASACTISNSFTIGNVTGGFSASSVVTDETCGNLNGAVDVSTIGGVGPLSFLWNTGDLTEDLSGLTAGNFNCVITDANGCTINIAATVNSYSQNFSIGAPVIVDEQCGDDSGSITLNPTGGTAPLTYSWDIPNPCCEYTLNMYDLNNNGWGGTPLPGVLVYINGALFGNFNVPTGNGNSFNSVQIPVCSGDVIEFEYSETTQNQNNTYEVLDSEGTMIFEDGPNPFNGVAFTTTAVCSAGNVSQLTDLSAGTYTVQITDSYGCSLADTFVVINQTGGFAISGSVISDESCEAANGAIDISVTGGLPPYSYSWNNGSVTEDLSGIAAGTYTVTVIDANGCEWTESFSVSGTGQAVDYTGASITDASCATCGDGAIDVSLGGAGSPYTYSWNTGDNTEDLSGINPGTYDLTITNADGCDTTVIFIVQNMASLYEENGISLTIYPNPSEGIFVMSYEALTEDFELRVSDASGRIVRVVNVAISQFPEKYTMDLSRLEPGSYDLSIKSNQITTVKRLIIQ